IKFFSVFLIIFFVLIGCENNNLNLEEGVTKVEVYNWKDNVLIKTFEDASFIKKIVTKLNNANGKKISDTADVSAPEYKVILEIMKKL
ncbi:hypothetical protein V7201_11770, partial [Bacillus sp. JJ1122]|uniref:hypothetical protein n=1 Tax=Bacillus sp. JJ1122 TaxID=3122951 RepID=UPI002FFDBB03